MTLLLHMNAIFLIGLRLTPLQLASRLIILALGFAFVCWIIYKFKKHLFWKVLAIVASLSVPVLSLHYLDLHQDRQKRIALNMSKSTYILYLEIPDDQKAIVYAPVPSHLALRNTLKITSGKGTIRVVDHPQGAALEINFSGSIRVEGHQEYAVPSNTPHYLTLYDQKKMQEIWEAHTKQYGNQEGFEDDFLLYQSQAHFYRVFYNNFINSSAPCQIFLALKNSFVDQYQSFWYKGRINPGAQTITLDVNQTYADSLGTFPGFAY